MCLNKARLKIARISKDIFSFVYCNKIENFRAFQVVNFKILFYLRKLEISEVSKFSILAFILKS